MSLKFTCPVCKNHRLEEVMTNTTVVTEILGIGEDGDLDYGMQINEGDDTYQYYQCIHCGFIIRNSKEPITDCVDMVEWVKNNCPQEEN